jgi:hypothetical protein
MNTSRRKISSKKMKQRRGFSLFPPIWMLFRRQNCNRSLKSNIQGAQNKNSKLTRTVGNPKETKPGVLYRSAIWCSTYQHVKAARGNPQGIVNSIIQCWDIWALLATLMGSRLNQHAKWEILIDWECQPDISFPTLNQIK